MHNWQIKASLFLNYFVFAILLNSVGTVILQVHHHYGVAEGDAALLEAFKDLSIAIASFVVSTYIARLGYKNAMLLALSAVTVACFVMPTLNTFWATKLLFAITGASFALIKMSVYSTIGLLTKDEKEHISLMNFLESFFMVGILTGYFIFSYFVDSDNPQSARWLQVYYVLGGLSLLALLLLLMARLDESKAHAHEETTPTNFAVMFHLLARPVVLTFVGCAFFYVLVEQSIMSWLPTFNNKVLHLSTALSIQMASIMAASTAAGRFLAGIVMQRLRWVYVLVGCLILAACLVLTAIPLAKGAAGVTVTGWGDAPLAAFVFPFIGLLLAPIYPAINSLILSSLPTQHHGLMSGLIIVFSALGGTTGSIITGNLFQRLGGETAFYGSLVPIGILLVLLLLFSKQLGK